MIFCLLTFTPLLDPLALFPLTPCPLLRRLGSSCVELECRGFVEEFEECGRGAGTLLMLVWFIVHCGSGTLWSKRRISWQSSGVFARRYLTDNDSVRTKTLCVLKVLDLSYHFDCLPSNEAVVSIVSTTP